MVQEFNNLIQDGRFKGKANFVFTPEISASLGSMFGTTFNPGESIVMGRDYHNDSRMLKRAFTAGVMSTGVNLLNLSDCTFPMLQFTIRRFGASGGVFFSGGHTAEGIYLRFVDAGGIELGRSEIQKIVNVQATGVRRVDPNEIGQINAIPQTLDVYIKSLEQFVNKKKIGKANLKIVVDCSYSPTGRVSPILFNDLGVETIALNTHYRQRSGTPIPNISTIRNVADIVKASNSHLGVCFDIDGSRILVIDENGLEISFEDLLMLFVCCDERIQKSKPGCIITTPSISPVAKRFIEESGFVTKQVKNEPGEISRQIREERACFAAADTLKYYFPQLAPISDGNFILLKILEIMSLQEDLISSLTRGFPKGKKINKSITVSQEVIDNIHDEIRRVVLKNGYKYHDILNEVKIISEDGTSVSLKVALYRTALLLSGESDDTNKAKEMISHLEKLISEF
ncbi:MAG: hypothetical protein JW891_02915 [Candidatus Lokiarchaeota archaeon]|nr:hypothetical protein [Candidatus Lokiarchaeota archaeon]